MKTLTKLIICLSFLLSSQLVFAQDTLSTQFEVESVQFVEKDGEQVIAITILNKGDFFNYPVIQVKVEGVFIANETGIFTTYGIIDKDTFVFPCDYETSEKVTFTILVTDGAFGHTHRLEFEYQP